MANYKIFEYLPYIDYTISYNESEAVKKESSKENLLMTHILRRIRFTERVRNLQGFWKTYIVSDEETPLDVAYKAYGSQELYWVILLYNDIYDPFTDWVMNQKDLKEYTEKKYGDKIDDIHHYEMGNNIMPPPSDIGMDEGLSADSWTHQIQIVGQEDYDYQPTPVTNRQWEQILNESKRIIKIPDKELIPEICDEAYRLLNK